MNEELLEICECEDIKDLIDKLLGYFSDLDEIKKYNKFLIVKDPLLDIEIISIVCWFDFDKGVV